MSDYQKTLIELIRLEAHADDLKKKIEFERDWIEERKATLNLLRDLNRKTRIKIADKKALYEKQLAEINKLDLGVNNDEL